MDESAMLNYRFAQMTNDEMAGNTMGEKGRI